MHKLALFILAWLLVGARCGEPTAAWCHAATQAMLSGVHVVPLVLHDPAGWPALGARAAFVQSLVVP